MKRVLTVAVLVAATFALTGCDDGRTCVKSHYVPIVQTILIGKVLVPHMTMLFICDEWEVTK